MSAHNSKKKLLAVAWPYANGDLHLGHIVGVFLPATIANDFYRLRGEDVIMVTGSDMHGTPTAVKAYREGREPLEVAQEQHLRHVELLRNLGIDFSLYTSTATENHAQTAQWVFSQLHDGGYISQHTTEQYWSEKERKFLLDRYVEGTCPYCDYEKARGDQCDNCGRTLSPDDLIAPRSIFGDTELEKRESTNYYLDLDKLQPLLEQHYQEHGYFQNDWRAHVRATTLAWIDQGLEPRAITRDMEGFGVDLPIGHELPGEEGEGKVLYVWFEAVIGYLSAAIELSKIAGGSGTEPNPLAEEIPAPASSKHEAQIHSQIHTKIPGQKLTWQDYWAEGGDHIYFMGKDNIPFHAVIWTAMLLGLNEHNALPFKLALPRDIPANQYLNLKGEKFSKSTGNMITATEFWGEFGADTARFFLISRMPESRDYSFTWDEFEQAVNGELVANLGNFVNRTLVFWNKYFAAAQIDVDFVSTKSDSTQLISESEATFAQVAELLGHNKFKEAWDQVEKYGASCNKAFNDSEIWQLAKTEFSAASIEMVNLMYRTANLAKLLRPFLPDMSRNIYKYLKLQEPELAVGKNHWVPFEFQELNLTELGEIADLKPLIKKLELSKTETDS